MRLAKKIFSAENVQIFTMFTLLTAGLVHLLPTTLLSLVQTKIGPLTLQVLLGSLAVFLALYDLLGRIEEDEK